MTRNGIGGRQRGLRQDKAWFLGEYAMLMPRRLESHLDVRHIPYSMIFHAPADSAQMAASVMHISGKEAAKAVALEAGVCFFAWFCFSKKVRRHPHFLKTRYGAEVGSSCRL